MSITDAWGDSIIYVEKNRYVYKCIDNVYGFYDSDNNIYNGQNTFVKDLTDALSTIRNGKNGRYLVNSIMKSKNTLQIVRGNRNFTEYDGISWNPLNTTGGIDKNMKTYRPSYIGLAHELGHVYDLWNNLTNGIWLENIPLPNGTTHNIMNSENYVTAWENLIREEHGLSPRLYYSNNIDGSPFEPSKLLDEKGLHRFYFLIELKNIPIFLPTSLLNNKVK